MVKNTIKLLLFTDSILKKQVLYNSDLAAMTQNSLEVVLNGRS